MYKKKMINIDVGKVDNSVGDMVYSLINFDKNMDCDITPRKKIRVGVSIILRSRSHRFYHWIMLLTPILVSELVVIRGHDMYDITCFFLHDI